MKYYLAYGSNLNVEQMKYRCPNARKCRTTVIHDYELVFRRGFLTIEPKPGAYVPVGIWEITDEDERNLDRYEGYPRFYDKKMIPMHFTGRDTKGNTRTITKECLVYIMQSGFPVKPPSDEYLAVCRIGYRNFGLDLGPLMKAYERAKWPEDYTTIYTTKYDIK